MREYYVNLKLVTNFDKVHIDYDNNKYYPQYVTL